MTRNVKSGIAAAIFTVLMAGAAYAADCCCKDGDGKMACCEEKAGDTPAPAPAPAPAPEHQH